MKAINQTNGNIIADNIIIADSCFSRMKGLLGRSSLCSGEGLLLRPCMAVHTLGMQFTIDTIFLDKKNIVVATGTLSPNRMSAVHFSAKSVIELPAGTIRSSSIRCGDLVSLS
jgi:uncharacterized membrane protein (UPF0127 family)